MNDPKKIASLIVSKKFSAENLKKDGAIGAAAQQGSADGETSDKDYAKADAARMLLAAIESKDATKLVKAFEALSSLCDDDGDEDEPSEDDSGEAE